MLFSLVVAHYQGTVSDVELNRCLSSVFRNSFCDFEVLVVHDGPLLRSWGVRVVSSKIRFFVTDRFVGDWGHTGRDFAMRRAEGEYVIHLNADNVLDSEVLGVLAEEIKSSGKKRYVLPVVMMGMRKDLHYDMPRDYSKNVILRGTPVYGKIDAMQLVMLRSEWKRFGYWYDKRLDGDGYMYQRFCEGNSFKWVNHLVGVHY